MKLILPLPDFWLHSVHYSVKYDRNQYCADKSSTGSNHISINKHHIVCCLNHTIATRRSDAKIKKKRGGVMNSTSASASASASASTVLTAKPTLRSKLHSQQQVSPTLLIQQAYSVQV